MGRLRAAPPRLRAAPSRFPAQPKQTDADLGTADHKAWAQRIKQRAGYRCEDPDHDPRQPRGGQGVTLYADHIQERQDAPHMALSDDNGMCRCASCHTRKTAKARAARLST